MSTATLVTVSAKNSAPKVDPLTCAIGAEVRNANLGAAVRDPGLMAEIRSLLLQYKVLFFRDQGITRAEHVAFARHFGEVEDHPVAGSDPEHPGLVRIYKSPEVPNDRYENAWHTDCDVAREATVRLRVALHRMSAGRRRHDVGQHGARLRAAARAHQEPDRRPARPPQHRSDVWRGDADREAPRPQGAVSRRRASGCAHPPRDGRKNSLRQWVYHPFHQLPYARQCPLWAGLRAGRCAAPAVPDQPGGDPRISGALALAAEQCRLLGQPLHPALCGHGLPPLPSQDG